MPDVPGLSEYPRTPCRVFAHALQGLCTHSARMLDAWELTLFFIGHEKKNDEKRKKNVLCSSLDV